MLIRRIKRLFQPQVADHFRKEYEVTDFGRRYGWWLCLRDQRIADLNYWRWDSDGQFRHEYRLFAFSPTFAEIGLDRERWCQADVSLESRFVEGFRECRILMAPLGDNLVSVRSVHVPEDAFMRVVRQAHARRNQV